MEHSWHLSFAVRFGVGYCLKLKTNNTYISIINQLINKKNYGKTKKRFSDPG